MKDIKKALPIFIIILIIACGASFYGGMKYSQSKKTSISGFPNFQNMTAEERQQRMSEMGSGQRPNGGTRQGGGGFAGGEIISKDDQSLTIKLQDGGTKIIFFSDSTQVMKSSEGTAEDLTVGKNIIANGESNQDGSVTAKTIQLRPDTQMEQPTPEKTE